MNGNRWRSDSNGYPHIFDHARLRYDPADTVRHRPTPETQMSATKPEVETGSGNNFERKQIAKRFQRLPHIFDHVRLRYDTGVTAPHRKHMCRPRNRKWRPEVEITVERKQMVKEMVKRFQRLPRSKVISTSGFHFRFRGRHWSYRCR